MSIEPIVELTAASTPLSPANPSVERDALYERFREKICVNTALDRTLVSYQGNKNIPFYSWFKYKEGFSEGLVHYILKQFEPGTLLDPFSGAGAALFAARGLGWNTKGIELLPVGIYATRVRLAADRINTQIFKQTVASLLQLNFAEYYDQSYSFRHIAITRGAFPEQEEYQLIGYITYCNQRVSDTEIRSLLLFAAFCILEEISYTRKDGQYLRWDARSGRSQGEVPFNKGRISTFREAITKKLEQIISDLEGNYVQESLFADADASPTVLADPELLQGSCLEVLPHIEQNSIDVVLTSPPYANRYDYTRTYALELLYLGCSDEQIKHLRQEMLSCTVENKDKKDRLESYYKSLGREVEFDTINTAFQEQRAVQEVLSILDKYQAEKKLNNPGIASLVRHYFYEMCFVVYELARILKPGGTVIMVNDNVRYAGEEVPVDLILSDIAESFGLTTKHIWTLNRGKGNSSQQMGNHGRSELRKCIYVWGKESHMAVTRDQLLIEAHQINYRLRSTFFYRKLKEYNVLAFPSIVASITPLAELYNWDQRANWGIGEDAFTYISSHEDLKPIQVFCHPKLLREYPVLLSYYRNIAALSQKSVSYLIGVNVAKYEADQDNKTSLNDKQISLLVRLFNEHMSLILDSSLQSFTEQELQGLLLTSTGAQIDGAWRNAIGEEAEKVVQRLLVKEAVKLGLLSAFIPRNSTGMEPFTAEQLETQLGSIGSYRGIMLNNQTSILFSSEPDISLIGRNGTTVGVIEVKGGTDPAGALERYGAAKKSFEDTLRTAPDAKTILVASCITPEALQRIDQDKTIFKYFNLTQIVKEKQKYSELVEIVFTLLDEIPEAEV
ncbi:MAG TPA: XcyI family restriction endonuclease [Ktedonobacteraceae bacterium]|nr:XcyI family restriction endonuclease [Ktedonobacteraceae bacterium]